MTLRAAGLTLVSRACAVVGAALALMGAAQAREVEDYIHVPMPPGIHVETTELEGPVFADSRGRTLYKWPLWELRNGYTGDPAGDSACDNHRYTESAGLMSPFPGGLILPEADTRPSCTDMWPIVAAPADAKPVGKWTIILRKDGQRQWAFDGHALYTSSLDHRPGDVVGGTAHNSDITDGPAVREPVGPPPNIPPGFAIVTTVNGRLLMTERHASVYTWAKDGPGKSNCSQACARDWPPVLAPGLAHARGEWSIIERAPGVRQWAYRGRPLYTHPLDQNPGSLEGSDVPGWSNVYTQRVASRPSDFTVQDADSGQVLADRRGMTLYTFKCDDDAVDQLTCDHPDTTQAYRVAFCGAGDPARCLTNFPYVLASPGARSDSSLWTVVTIDPISGHLAKPGQAGALRVWAYRDRPVYTYAGDARPGDAKGDSIGEYTADRFGFKAFWVRDDIFIIVAR